MNEFAHIRMIVGYILSLSIAQLLRGIARFIVHPGRARPYWVHLLWVVYMFLTLIYFWWWEYELHKVTEWTFASYVLVIFYVILFCFICFLLFPEDLAEYAGYKEYYFARLQWFFGILAATFVIDLADTSLKGKAYLESLGPEYPVRTAVQFVLCLLATRIKNERYHAGLAILLIAYDISWISRKYLTE